MQKDFWGKCIKRPAGGFTGEVIVGVISGNLEIENEVVCVRLWCIVMCVFFIVFLFVFLKITVHAHKRSSSSNCLDKVTSSSRDINSGLIWQILIFNKLPFALGNLSRQWCVRWKQVKMSRTIWNMFHLFKQNQILRFSNRMKSLFSEVCWSSVLLWPKPFS